ncbi:MAG TPA: hypothetical protein VF465_03160 [Flavobacterium sp.]|uniref:hypothetical protein n=1 Tax=Flavobacterium sp. TaxID=239 RepID=UPI002ED28103
MFKSKENTLRLIALTILIVIVIFFGNYFSGNRQFHERKLKNRMKESYSGVVLEKFIDSSEHCTPMLKLRNNEIIPLENSFWDQIEIGDSIVKIKNQKHITLFKNNKIKEVFDYSEYIQNLIERSK